MYSPLHKKSKPAITKKRADKASSRFAMDAEKVEYYQSDFFGLLPGAAGGRALRAIKDSAYFRELARTAAERRSKEARQAIASKAACERRRRLDTTARTIRYVELNELVTERIIPWWPHQKNRQHRKKPVFVRIELQREKVSE